MFAPACGEALPFSHLRLVRRGVISEGKLGLCLIGLAHFLHGHCRARRGGKGERGAVLISSLVLVVNTLSTSPFRGAAPRVGGGLVGESSCCVVCCPFASEPCTYLRFWGGFAFHHASLLACDCGGIDQTSFFLVLTRERYYVRLRC